MSKTSKTNVSQPAGIPPLFYERKGTEKDAVALTPVLRGAIRLHNSSVLSLMHPLIRLHCPETNIRSQAWKLHVGRPLATVQGALRLCKIKFFHTLHPPTDFLANVLGAATTEATATNSSAVSFQKVLAKINEIEGLLIASLEHQKTTIAANAKAIRETALLELAGTIGVSGTTDTNMLKDQLYAKMLAAWNKSTKQLMSLPFKHKYSHRGVEDWSGLDNFDTFWSALLNGAQKADSFTAYSAKVGAQETAKIDTIIASMKLSLEYYVELQKVIAVEDNIKSALADLIKTEILGVDMAANRLSFNSYELWQDYVGQFFSDVLTERLEVLQSHVYTYFSATIGRGKEALKRTGQFMEKLIYGVSGEFFKADVDLNIAQGESNEAAELRMNVAKCRNLFINALKQLELDIKPLLDEFKVKPIKDEDKLVIRERVKKMFAGLPDQTKIVRNGELYDSSIPSAITFLNSVWTRNMAWNMEAPPIGKSTPAVKLHHKAHRGRECLQRFINGKIVTAIGTQANTNVAFAVSAAVLHANGLQENAFAAVLCTTQASKSQAAAYLSAYNFPMQPVTTSTLPTLDAELQKPTWVSIVPRSDAPHPYLTSLVSRPDSGSPYVDTISKLFAVEITVQPSLTKRQNGKSKQRKPKAKKGGKKKEGGNGGSNNQNKGGKKQQPSTNKGGGGKKQQNANVNQPKKPAHPAGKKGKK